MVMPVPLIEVSAIEALTRVATGVALPMLGEKDPVLGTRGRSPAELTAADMKTAEGQGKGIAGSRRELQPTRIRTVVAAETTRAEQPAEWNATASQKGHHVELTAAALGACRTVPRIIATALTMRAVIEASPLARHAQIQATTETAEH